MRTNRRFEPGNGLARPSRTRRAAVAIATVGLLLTTGGADPADDNKPAAEPGGRALFDGKSLAGWKKTDFGGEGEVKVQDGAIVIAVGKPMSGITSTHDNLPRTNYELTYEARRLSGVDFFAAATFPVGKSYITLVNGGWGGNVTGLSSLDGADASENETSRFYEYKNQTWYRFRVQVTDRVIRCWIDDRLVVDVDHSDRQVSTRIETRDNQPLGFATWDTSGAIRKIAIRPLTPAEIEATKKKPD
jgi:hypothetical protein